MQTRDNGKSQLEPTVPSVRRLALIVVFMLGLAFTLRIGNITGESLWRDEVDSIRFAFASFDELLRNLSRHGFNGPLYELLVRAWLTLAGVNDFALRYLSLIFGVLQVALIYNFSRRLFGSLAALIAALTATLAPVLIWYSGEGKMYTLQPTLLLLALYAMHRAISLPASRALPNGRMRNLGRRMNGWWIVFVAAVSLAFYVHLLSPLFLAVALIFLLLWWRRTRLHWIGAVISFALCTIPYVPMAAWQLPTFIQGLATGHEFLQLDLMLSSLLINWSVGLSASRMQGVSDAFVISAVVFFVVIDCLGLWATASTWTPKGVPDIKHADSTILFRSAIGVFVWLLLPVLLVYVISLRAPVFQPRYLLWSAPALYILIGIGISWLMTRARVAAIVCLALVVLISLYGTIAQWTIPLRPDVRGAARIMALNMQLDDIAFFQIPYTRYGFLYYVPRFNAELPIDLIPNRNDGLMSVQGLREKFIDAPYTNRNVTPDDVIAYLAPLVGDAKRVWLVESEASMWDERQMARQWFDGNLRLALTEELHGVRVTLYEKP